MPRLPADINSDNLGPHLRLELGWTTPGSTCTEASMAPVDQPVYSPYEELSLPLNGNFMSASSSTHSRLNQNTTLDSTADRNHPLALSTAFHSSAKPTSHVTSSNTSPLTYLQHDKGIVQYSAVNTNGPRTVATVFDGSENHITYIPTPVVLPSTYYPPNQSTVQHFSASTADPREFPTVLFDPVDYTMTTPRSAPLVNFPLMYPHQGQNDTRYLAVYRDNLQNLPTAIDNSPSDRFTNAQTPYIYNHGRCGGTFTAKGSLTRHNAEQHTAQSFPCPITGCDKAYSRKYHMTEHKRKSHGSMGSLDV
ncbi:uncharacterized protein N7500_007033 [Penicillium coprophilum]|uniref:uncharacterized protein n=1 Tax=Penicillium coprophilum TaxID=36646 RepID=UPI00238BCA2A|nr:uncharacterized protein N7500_007033 [Penicillium coprophilum]KAJ5165203.1 hypothetical protein N7500_007033 [Penicillium coprophilum]